MQKQGFLIDSICAFRPAQPLEDAAAEGAGWQMRAFTPDDEEAVVALFREELAYHDEPGFTPAGLYGCLDNVCVSASVRGMGIGRALTQQALLNMQQWQPDGYLLWYSADNPLSSRFWTTWGFTPLWTTTSGCMARE